MSRYKDADAMIQELKRQYMFLFGTDEIPNGIGMFLENFPTADVVEVVHGEWISDEDGNISCSVCGRSGVGESFCEHCGAKMDGVV